MEISELTLKLILLLIPGAVSSVLFEKLTIHRKWTPFQFVANSIMFGGADYLVAQLIGSLLTSGDSLSSFWENLPTKDIPFNVIIEGVLVAPFMGLLFTLLDFHRVINKLGKFLHISYKYGDLNLFTHFLNSPDVKEVYVRDIDNNITYHGKLHSYSETDAIKELLLYDVDIYDYTTGDKSYSVRSVYLSKAKDKVTIEIPYIVEQSEATEETVQS